MKSRSQKDKVDLKKRFTVILIKPKKPENIGLVARGMKNTGFEQLRLVGIGSISKKSYLTAVHAKEILDEAKIYADIAPAVADFQLVFAATSKKRKNFALLSLKEAVTKMFRFPSSTKIGLLFGCERTGLTSEELKKANFAFTIPQASKQPSYNLSAAVLITLFQIFTHSQKEQEVSFWKKPISRKEQEECIRLILNRLEEKKFLHETNKTHVTEMIYDLFGRLTMNSKDQRLLLALFSKGVNNKE